MTDRRLVKATAALALIGVGITAYLTFAHYADGSIVCPTDGCETVQRSSYALLGSVPVALLGLGAYLVILGGLFLPRDYSRPAVLARPSPASRSARTFLPSRRSISVPFAPGVWRVTPSSP
jgi:hypothetical protein